MDGTPHLDIDRPDEIPKPEKKRSFFSNLKLKKKKNVKFDDNALVDVIYVSSSSVSITDEIDLDEMTFFSGPLDEFDLADFPVQPMLTDLHLSEGEVDTSSTDAEVDASDLTPLEELLDCGHESHVDAAWSEEEDLSEVNDLSLEAEGDAVPSEAESNQQIDLENVDLSPDTLNRALAQAEVILTQEVCDIEVEVEAAKDQILLAHAAAWSEGETDCPAEEVESVEDGALEDSGKEDNVSLSAEEVEVRAVEPEDSEKEDTGTVALSITDITAALSKEKEVKLELQIQNDSRTTSSTPTSPVNVLGSLTNSMSSLGSMIVQEIHDTVYTEEEIFSNAPSSPLDSNEVVTKSLEEDLISVTSSSFSESVSENSTGSMIVKNVLEVAEPIEDKPQIPHTPPPSEEQSPTADTREDDLQVKETMGIVASHPRPESSCSIDSATVCSATGSISPVASEEGKVVVAGRPQSSCSIDSVTLFSAFGTNRHTEPDQRSLSLTEVSSLISDESTETPRTPPKPFVLSYKEFIDEFELTRSLCSSISSSGMSLDRSRRFEAFGTLSSSLSSSRLSIATCSDDSSEQCLVVKDFPAEPVEPASSQSSLEPEELLPPQPSAPPLEDIMVAEVALIDDIIEVFDDIIDTFTGIEHEIRGYIKTAEKKEIDDDTSNTPLSLVIDQDMSSVIDDGTVSIKSSLPDGPESTITKEEVIEEVVKDLVQTTINEAVEELSTSSLQQEEITSSESENVASLQSDETEYEVVVNREEDFHLIEEAFEQSIMREFEGIGSPVAVSIGELSEPSTPSPFNRDERLSFRSDLSVCTSSGSEYWDAVSVLSEYSERSHLLLDTRLSEAQVEELNKLDDEAAPSPMSASLIQQFIKTCSPAVENAYISYLKTPLDVLEREMSSDAEEDDSLGVLVEPVDVTPEDDLGTYSQIAESIGTPDTNESLLNVLVNPLGICPGAGVEEGTNSETAEYNGSAEEEVGIREASGEVIQLCELIDNMLEECFEVRAYEENTEGVAEVEEVTEDEVEEEVEEQVDPRLRLVLETDDEYPFTPSPLDDGTPLDPADYIRTPQSQYAPSALSPIMDTVDVLANHPELMFSSSKIIASTDDIDSNSGVIQMSNDSLAALYQAEQRMSFTSDQWLYLHESQSDPGDYEYARADDELSQSCHSTEDWSGSDVPQPGPKDTPEAQPDDHETPEGSIYMDTPPPSSSSAESLRPGYHICKGGVRHGCPLGCLKDSPIIGSLDDLAFLLGMNHYQKVEDSINGESSGEIHEGSDHSEEKPSSSSEAPAGSSSAYAMSSLSLYTTSLEQSGSLSVTESPGEDSAVSVMDSGEDIDHLAEILYEAKSLEVEQRLDDYQNMLVETRDEFLTSEQLVQDDAGGNVREDLRMGYWARELLSDEEFAHIRGVLEKWGRYNVIFES